MRTVGDTREQAARILVVDDDPEIGFVLKRYLEGQGFGVEIADCGSRLREAMRFPSFDLVLLDLGLPDTDGLGLMTELRRQWSGPVIIITGRGESVERVVGLELGADDYLGKPFDLRELLARIRSVMRRATPLETRSGERMFAFDGLVLAPDMRRLTGRNDEEITLTTGEFDLLMAFLEQPSRVLSRDHLLNTLHGRDAGPFDRAIDVQIGRLRRKIERDPANPRLIQSVRGTGYLMTASVERR
jgi:two-component system OmpR family response regulator